MKNLPKKPYFRKTSSSLGLVSFLAVNNNAAATTTSTPPMITVNPFAVPVFNSGRFGSSVVELLEFLC